MDLLLLASLSLASSNRLSPFWLVHIFIEVSLVKKPRKLSGGEHIRRTVRGGGQTTPGGQYSLHSRLIFATNGQPFFRLAGDRLKEWTNYLKHVSQVLRK
jgi:hypothetical protein